MPKTIWECEVCGRLFSIRRQAEICESHRPERPPIEVGQVITIRTWDGHETERRTVLGMELSRFDTCRFGHEWKARIAETGDYSLTVHLWDDQPEAELVGMCYVNGASRWEKKEKKAFREWYDEAGAEYRRLAGKYAKRQSELWRTATIQAVAAGDAIEAFVSARATVRWARRMG